LDLNIVIFPEKFDSAGVKLIAIGVVTPDKAAMLADRCVLDCALDFRFVYVFKNNHLAGSIH
jgi:hypothetical protein